MDLNGAVAVLTGGAAGLGAYVAEALRRRGTQVVVADRSEGVDVTNADARGDEPYGCAGYAVAKAGLIRCTTARPRIGPAGEVRVSTVVPGWIGLPRAHREYAALSPEEQRTSGGLIDPDRLAEVIVDLAAHGVGGTVLAVDADGEPYPLPGISAFPPDSRSGPG